MEDYKPNSRRSKGEVLGLPDKKAEPEKKPIEREKVITGSARTRKKSRIQKLAGAFVSEDVDDVKSYIFTGILVPAIKKFIQDSVDAFLYPDGSSPRRRNDGRPSYSRYYNDRERDIRRDDRRAAQIRRYEYDDIVLDSKGDYERVLNSLEDDIRDYGFATLAALYDYAGLDAPPTYNNYGWNSIRGFDYKRLSDGGYLVIVPRPHEIDG